ncbi:MAG: response regulator [Flaviaesturariibacter sp.]|nr:response regulator [Flaviaesturariibacter sp.]
MPKSILVIDDNNDLRDNTVEILELAGYRTLAAENGKKGIEVATREKPDLIVCDIMMPELDGYGVLHLVRKNPDLAQVPFIFLTARTERSDFRKGMEMGADDYVTKPFDDVELLNAIEARLKKAAVLDHRYDAGAAGLTAFLKDARDAGMLRQMSDHYEVIQISKRQSLYTEGKRPRFLFFLVSGKVKAHRTHEEGKEYITDLFSPGDFIGYAALLDDRNYDDTASILEDAEVMQIPREEFLQMVDSDIAIAAKFIRIATHSVKEKEDRLLNLAYSSLRKRVARALVEIHEKYNAEGEALFEFSRDDIAQYVGTATESLIRTLSDFKGEGLIAIRNGKISILALEKLRNLLY